MLASLPQRHRDPVTWTNISQLLKTVLAAVIVWVLASQVFDIEQAFLAPWAALLTVHATVYRTLRRGVQQVGASVVGVVVATAAGGALGLNAFSLGVAILLGLSPARCAGCAPRRRRQPQPRSSSSPPATATTATCWSHGCSTPASASRSACS